MIKYYKDDLIALALKGAFDVIAHGCNCQCTFGSGIAKSIKVAFPEAYTADLKTVKGDRNKLGTYTYAIRELESLNKQVTIVNLYTQFWYSKESPQLDYNALRNCFKLMKRDFSGLKIGLPLIGAGLAQGDWNQIESVINEEMVDEDVSVIIYSG